MKSLLICFISISTLLSCAQSKASKTDKIRQLLDLTGSGKLGVQVANNMMASFKKSYNNVDDQFWEEFARQIKAEDLVNLIIPIYDKYYTEEDIDQLIGFYKSPIGKKVIETLPQITQESMLAGQAWGKQIGESVVEELKRKGYLEK